MLFDCLSDHQGDVMRKPTNIAEKDEDLKMAEIVQQMPCQTTPLQEDSVETGFLPLYKTPPPRGGSFIQMHLLEPCIGK